MAIISARENCSGDFFGGCLAAATSYTDKYDAAQENISVEFCRPAENIPSATVQGFDEPPYAPLDCSP